VVVPVGLVKVKVSEVVLAVVVVKTCWRFNSDE